MPRPLGRPAPQGVPDRGVPPQARRRSRGGGRRSALPSAHGRTQPRRQCELGVPDPLRRLRRGRGWPDRPGRARSRTGGGDPAATGQGPARAGEGLRGATGVRDADPRAHGRDPRRARLRRRQVRQDRGCQRGRRAAPRRRKRSPARRRLLPGVRGSPQGGVPRQPERRRVEQVVGADGRDGAAEPQVGQDPLARCSAPPGGSCCSAGWRRRSAARRSARNSASTCAALFDRGFDAVVFTDARGEIRTANEAFLNLSDVANASGADRQVHGRFPRPGQRRSADPDRQRHPLRPHAAVLHAPRDRLRNPAPGRHLRDAPDRRRGCVLRLRVAGYLPGGSGDRDRRARHPAKSRRT